jgi:hypothetical protein
MASFHILHASCFALRFHSALLHCACSAFIHHNSTLLDVWRGLPQCVKQTVKKGSRGKINHQLFLAYFAQELSYFSPNQALAIIFVDDILYSSKFDPLLHHRVLPHISYSASVFFVAFLLAFFSFLLSVIVRLCWWWVLEILVVFASFRGLTFKT